MCKRILFLTDVYQHTICHDNFFEQPYRDREIIKNRYNCDIYLWGPGIDGEKVDWSEPLQDKIKNRFGDKYFFDIIVQLPGGGILDNSYYSARDSRTLILIHFHEVPHGLDCAIINRIQPHIIFYISNENAINRYTENQNEKHVITAFPMYNSISYSKKFLDLEKDIDLLIAGNTSPQIYPLRDRIVRLIKNNKDRFQKYNIHIRHTKANQYTPEQIIDGEFTYEEKMKMIDEYLELIGRSKLTLCTSHVKNDSTGVRWCNFRLRKYVEIGMSGSLRIGEPSDEDYSGFGENGIIDVTNMSDPDIVDTIIYYIENDEARKARLNEQQKYEEKFSAVCYVKNIIDMYGKYRSKKYGYYNIVPFRLTKY